MLPRTAWNIARASRKQTHKVKGPGASNTQPFLPAPRGAERQRHSMSTLTATRTMRNTSASPYVEVIQCDLTSTFFGGRWPKTAGCPGTVCQLALICLSNYPTECFKQGECFQQQGGHASCESAISPRSYTSTAFSETVSGELLMLGNSPACSATGNGYPSVQRPRRMAVNSIRTDLRLLYIIFPFCAIVTFWKLHYNF